MFGGDGTFQKILNYIFKENSELFSKVVFGFMPFGSGNGLARNLNMPFAYDQIIGCIKRNKFIDIDFIVVNERYLVIHNLGFGFDALISKKFNEGKNRGGLFYFLLVLRNILFAKKFRFNIKTPKFDFDINAIMITISNTNQFGMQFKIAPQAKLDDSLLDVVIVPKQNVIFLIFNLLRYFMNRKLNYKSNSKEIIYFQTQSIMINNVDMAPLHFGGDFLINDYQKLECKILERKIKCLIN